MDQLLHVDREVVPTGEHTGDDLLRDGLGDLLQGALLSQVDVQALPLRVGVGDIFRLIERQQFFHSDFSRLWARGLLRSGRSPVPRLRILHPAADSQCCSSAHP